jgi:predicted dehydrogenase
VLGLRRGAALARLARDAGMRLVAVCERDNRRREVAAAALGVAAYRDLEPFLDHPMDAVILVNYFDQHAPAAISALDRGLSVLSETAACRTLAEGVALIEAAERSSGIYMFAENYPYMPFTREMRRRYTAGDIGEVRYAEAEYLDEPADLMSMADDRSHWRARLPATYYCTHSLAPVAAITGTRPVQVTGFVVPTAGDPTALERARQGRGWAALLVVRLDNGAMGDGVAETLMLRDFANAVRHQRAPHQDVHFGVELSVTGIQALRSSLAGSVPVEVPDLRRADVRRACAADEWFPELPEL